MNTITTTGEPAATKHRPRTYESIDSQLLAYTQQLLDRYGAGNLPIVERELSAKLNELINAVEKALQPDKTKKPTKVPPVKLICIYHRPTMPADKPAAQTGDHPP